MTVLCNDRQYHMNRFCNYTCFKIVFPPASVLLCVWPWGFALGGAGQAPRLAVTCSLPFALWGLTEDAGSGVTRLQSADSGCTSLGTLQCFWPCPLLPGPLALTGVVPSGGLWSWVCPISLPCHHLPLCSPCCRLRWALHWATSLSVWRIPSISVKLSGGPLVLGGLACPPRPPLPQGLASLLSCPSSLLSSCTQAAYLFPRLTWRPPASGPCAASGAFPYVSPSLLRCQPW